ncbi:tetratricopeptide repeat (TPR)-containing protein [Artemisia annua]|uniref:Tetratricopeptide repeat (TPR)-containing protein n=1 Tax=Artemisia annua TaxID=35608 RepID=A0A2U1NWX2_ARTAN|nr:tetratricopeptide repeat (TPR)-containing protein [Artemisia annua]
MDNKFMIRLHRCLIRFFHKVSSLSAPTTDAEKLISGVVEAERPTFQDMEIIAESQAYTNMWVDLLMFLCAVAGLHQLDHNFTIRNICFKIYV